MALGSLIGAGASILGGLIGKSSTDKANKKNIQLQKDFAQQGVQWRAADARKAGIHPLYALGAQTNSFSPSVVGDTSLASGLASAGQDISRAVQANSPQSQRDRMYNDQVQALTLKRYGLENELLASQIAKTNAQLGPAIPTDGLITKDDPRTDYTLFGKKIKASPSMSDAGTLQQRLGEMMDYLALPLVGGADVVHRYKDWKNPATELGQVLYNYLRGRR